MNYVISQKPRSELFTLTVLYLLKPSRSCFEQLQSHHEFLNRSEIAQVLLRDFDERVLDFQGDNPSAFHSYSPKEGHRGPQGPLLASGGGVECLN